MPNDKQKRKQAKKANKAVVRVVVPRPQKKKNKQGPRRKKSNVQSMGSSSCGGGFPPPVSMAGTMRVKHQQSLVVAGTDFLGTVGLTASTSNSAIIDSWLINPIAMMPGSRLAQFGELWDKYRFVELEVIAESVQGTNATGTICMAMDPDVYDDYSLLTGDTLIQRMSTAPANVSFPVWQPTSIRTPGKFFNDPIRWVDPNTDADARFVYTGKLWVASVGGLNPGNYLRLYCRWKIQFENPALDTSFADGTSIIATQSSAQITATYPWGDYSTILAGGTGYAGNPSVVFRSSATLGSVIQFNAPGFYVVSMYRTGTAMGTSAFTAAVLNNCSLTYTPAIPGIGDPFSWAIANAGSNTSMWIAIIEANKAGATISSTGDTGVTHQSATTFVSKFSGAFSRSTVPSPISVSSVNSKVQEMEAMLKTFMLQDKRGPNLVGLPEFTTSSVGTITEAPDVATGVTKSYQLTQTEEVDQQLPVEVVPPALDNLKLELQKQGYILIPPMKEKEEFGKKPQ